MSVTPSYLAIADAIDLVYNYGNGHGVVIVRRRLRTGREPSPAGSRALPRPTGRRAPWAQGPSQRRWTGEPALRPNPDAGLNQLVSGQVGRNHDRLVLAHMHAADDRADDNVRLDPRATPRLRSPSRLPRWTVRSPVAEGSLDTWQPSAARSRNLLSTPSRIGLSRAVRVDRACPLGRAHGGRGRPGCPRSCSSSTVCFRNPRLTWPGRLESKGAIGSRSAMRSDAAFPDRLTEIGELTRSGGGGATRFRLSLSCLRPPADASRRRSVRLLGSARSAPNPATMSRDEPIRDRPDVPRPKCSAVPCERVHRPREVLVRHVERHRAGACVHNHAVGLIVGNNRQSTSTPRVVRQVLRPSVRTVIDIKSSTSSG